MLHGVSFLEVDNSRIQQAIADNKHKDYISKLKQSTAFNAVYGFQYEEKSFEDLGLLLSHDYGFNPFKYKSVEEGAVYNKDKHPNAWGRVRGKFNTNNKASWVCLDVDNTTIPIESTHSVLRNINHHIATTSDKNNRFKYRILIELDRVIDVEPLEWKLFIKSIGDSLGISADELAASQVIYGYEGRDVYSVLGKTKLDPSTHLKMARMKLAIQAEEKVVIGKEEASKLLQSPFTTFGYAYDAKNGEGNNMMLGAIQHAKELGADKAYIIDMIYSINDFWDNSMPISRLQDTILTSLN